MTEAKDATTWPTFTFEAIATIADRATAIERELFSARNEVDRLRSALLPFRDAYKQFTYEGSQWRDHEKQWDGDFAGLSVGDLRRAAEALEGK